MRADVLNLKVYPVRTEMTGKQQIPILHVFLWKRANKKSSLTTKLVAGLFYRQWKIRKRYS